MTVSLLTRKLRMLFFPTPPLLRYTRIQTSYNSPLLFARAPQTAARRENGRSLWDRKVTFLTREDWMTICLASCLPAFQLHSQTLPQTSGWILHTNSLLSTTDGLNGFLLKKEEEKRVLKGHIKVPNLPLKVPLSTSK